MARVPAALPILSPGRHRRPRRGACLMEYTSVLAGERFSDSPRCTDPVLAAVARSVNDYTGDTARQRLAPLAGDLTTANGAGDDVRRGIVRRCLLTALPYATGDRRRVLVVALMGLDRAAAGQSRGWTREMLALDTELGLVGCDSDVAVAERYLHRLSVTVGDHSRRGMTVAVEAAVATIAAEADDADDVLCALLDECLADYRRALGAAQPTRAAWTRDSTS
jgi:hypothetical protein